MIRARSVVMLMYDILVLCQMYTRMVPRTRHVTPGSFGDDCASSAVHSVCVFVFMCLTSGLPRANRQSSDKPDRVVVQCATSSLLYS